MDKSRLLKRKSNAHLTPDDLGETDAEIAEPVFDKLGKQVVDEAAVRVTGGGDVQAQSNAE